MQSKSKQLAFRIIVAMLFLLPFHAIGTVFLNYGLNLSALFGGAQVVNLWKEVLLIVLTFLLLKEVHGRERGLILDSLDYAVIAFMIYGVGHFIFLYVTGMAKFGFGQFLVGSKYEFEFLYALLIVRQFRFNRTQILTCVKWLISGGVLSLLFGYFFHFVITPERLTSFGFRNDWSTWYPGQSLAFCQRIEHQDVCRMAGTFAGPNQFGAYLVILMPLFWLWKRKIITLFEHKILWHKSIPMLLFSAALIALFLTFSRAAYIGAFLLLVILAAYELDVISYMRKWRFFFAIFGFGVSIFIMFISFKEFLIRPDSTYAHLEAWKLGISEMFASPFGQGIGSAGPASYRLSYPIIPENWYLQVGVELGFVGLFLFLLLCTLICYKLYPRMSHRHVRALGATFLATMAMAMFLHTFEDASVSLTLFMMLGLELGEEAI